MACGARDYLAKPVRMHSLEHLWRHPLGKEKWRSYIAKINGNTHELGKCSSKVREEIIGTNSRFPKGIMKLKEELIDGERRRTGSTVSSSSSSSNKPRISWTPELHRKFVSAVNQLGTKASPKKIVQVMRVPDLTATHVASHLQKYRRTLKKAAAAPVSLASSTPLASDLPQAISSQCNSWIDQDRDAGFDREESNPLIDLDIDAMDDFLMHQSLVSNDSGSFTLLSFGNNHDSGKREECGSFYQDNYHMNQGFAGQDYNLVPVQYVNGGVLTDTDTNLGPSVGSGGEALMDTANNSKALTLYQSSHITTQTNIYDDSDEFIEDLLNTYWYN